MLELLNGSSDSQGPPNSSPNEPESTNKKLHLSEFQWVLLAAVGVIGAVIAHSTGAWAVLIGPVLGIALGLAIVVFGTRVLQQQWIRKLAFAVSQRIGSVTFLVVRNVTSAEHYQSFIAVWQFWARIWRALDTSSRAVCSKIVLGGLLETPLRLSGWLFVGAIVRQIFGGRTSFGPPDPTALYLMLGVYFCIKATEAVVESSEREAIRIGEDEVKTSLTRRLLCLKRLPQHTRYESELKLGDARSEVKRHSYKIGKFMSNGAAILEECFNLVILLSLMLWISLPGGALTILAVVFLVYIRQFDLLHLKKTEHEAVQPRIELSVADRLNNDPRMAGLAVSISKPETIEGYLLAKVDRIAQLVQAGRTIDSQRQTVALLAFFTLFALSTLHPMDRAMAGELSVRVALLYFVSLYAIWGAISRISFLSSKMVEDIEELTEVDEIVQALEEVDRDPTLVEDPPASANERVTSEIAFPALRFNYPFRPTLLDFRVPFSTRRTLVGTDMQPVRLFSEPRAGGSTTLKLLAGWLKPTQEQIDLYGSIAVGEKQSFHDDMARWVILIPEDPPSFEGVKLRELFHMYCGVETSDSEIERCLREFELFDELHSDSGGFPVSDLLIGRKGRYLTAEERQLLFLALHYCALKSRVKDYGGFNPAVVAVDGIHRISLLSRRKKVAELFRKLTEEFHATFVSVVRSMDEIGEKDYVVPIVSPQLAPPDFRDHGKGNVVLGGSQRNYYYAPDKERKKWYREWTESVAGLY